MIKINFKNIKTPINKNKPDESQNLRKIIYNHFNEQVNKPNSIFQNVIDDMNFAGKQYITLDLNRIRFFNNNIDELRMKFTKEKSKELGIKIKNKTKTQIDSIFIFNILQGLILSKKALKKLPKNIRLKNLQEKNKDNKITLGEFRPFNFKSIYLDPNACFNDVFKTVVHENIHKNDFSPVKFYSVLIGGIIIHLIPTGAKVYTKIEKIIKNKQQQLIENNADLIKNQIRDYACTNRDEFIACTGQKLITEGKNWDDLDPKIKEIYDKFKGPKLKLSETHKS